MGEKENYDFLKLENQLSFPLYAASKEIVRMYTPYLKPLGITYTQYITLLVLWEKQHVTVGEIGKLLFLDSGTLTPLLKKLENNGLVTRSRSEGDERVVVIDITEKGMLLKEKAKSIPKRLDNEIGSCCSLTEKEKKTLYKLLYKILTPEAGI